MEDEENSIEEFKGLVIDKAIKGVIYGGENIGGNCDICNNGGCITIVLSDESTVTAWNSEWGGLVYRNSLEQTLLAKPAADVIAKLGKWMYSAIPIGGRCAGCPAVFRCDYEESMGETHYYCSLLGSADLDFDDDCSYKHKDCPKP